MFARSNLLALATSAVLAIAAIPASAAISIATPSSIYSQNFDSLTTSTTASAWANDSTLTGWSLFNSTGAAITTIVGGDGASNTGSFYSFGGASSTERALGGTGSAGAYFGTPASGAVAGYIAVAFTNASAAAYDSFTVGFNGEQWRNGGNATAQSMVLQYGFGATFGAVASWTAPGSAFNWTSRVNTATAAALDGNSAANRVTGVGGTVAAPWAAGTTLWVRWVENNDVGNDHGLAIDNFSLSVTAVPEADTWAMLLAGLGLIGFIGRRRIR